MPIQASVDAPERGTLFMTARASAYHRSKIPHDMVRPPIGATVVLLSFLAAGCATAPLEEMGSLRSYESLKRSDGLLTQSRLRVNKDNVLAAKTVKIIPTSFLTRDGRETFTPAQQGLIANAIDRSLCTGLSERFAVVSSSEPADISVHAAVTHVEPTDPVAVGLSKGAMVVKTVLLPGVPVPVPRIPIGLGSLSLEAEARDQQGSQEAAMIWGRGATALSGGMARASRDGDAYDLAAAFGDDFSKLLVTGETPFGTMPSLPSAESLGALFGSAPKYPACEAFGRSSGLIGLIGNGVGVPPDWTDKGAAASPQ